MFDSFQERMEQKEALIEKIKEKGKYAIKIKTVAAYCGYPNLQRIRKSTLNNILTQLSEWGISSEIKSGESGNDYISLSISAIDSVHGIIAKLEIKSEENIFDTDIFPLSELYFINGLGQIEKKKRMELDLNNCVWAFAPILLSVEATDEYFNFIICYFSTMMKRRNQMHRSLFYNETNPQSPEILTLSILKQKLQIGEGNYQQILFPENGAVYIIRDNAKDFEQDEVVSNITECYLPHTYRMQSIYGSSTNESLESDEQSKFPYRKDLIKWLSALSGTIEISDSIIIDTADMAAVLTSAVQARENLLLRKSLEPTDPKFKAGYESTEHMVIKSLLIKYLRNSYPGVDLNIEEIIEPKSNELNGLEDSLDRSRRDKPDIRMGEKIWIEVETMRGIAIRGSNPFFSLEGKLRQKLEGMKSSEEVWLIVPSDIALLGRSQITALARNLNSFYDKPKIKWGICDLQSGEPVFFKSYELPAVQVKLNGLTGRTKKQIKSEGLNWDDIAGYSDLKERLTQDIIAPLMDPEKYACHGISVANGLLLYGLPGVGKSLAGRVLAGEAKIDCRLLFPSDLTSMWLGEGVQKIRAMFDWAIKQSPFLIILDELDAVAPKRREDNMHADEKRQVNELLAQLDRIAGSNVIVVATTNYIKGIDTAIQRSGRFDVKIPVFPPDERDREKIFNYYLKPPRLMNFVGIEKIDLALLAKETVLFTPADIKNVVNTAARKVIANNQKEKILSSEVVLSIIRAHTRSLKKDMVLDWLSEADEEMGKNDKRLLWLKEEIEKAFGNI